MKQIIVFLVLIITLNSCELKDDCGACFTPPPQFNFQFVDKDSDEDLIFNGTVNLDDIQVFDEDSTSLNFRKHLIDDHFIISIETIGWELDPKTYSIHLNDTIDVVFDLDMNTVSEDCCTFFEVETFDVVDYEYEVDSLKGIIVIKI